MAIFRRWDDARVLVVRSFLLLARMSHLRQVDDELLETALAHETKTDHPWMFNFLRIPPPGARERGSARASGEWRGICHVPVFPLRASASRGSPRRPPEGMRRWRRSIYTPTFSQGKPNGKREGGGEGGEGAVILIQLVWTI